MRSVVCDDDKEKGRSGSILVLVLVFYYFMLNHLRAQHKLYFYMTSRGNGIWQSPLHT